MNLTQKEVQNLMQKSIAEFLMRFHQKLNLELLGLEDIAECVDDERIAKAIRRRVKRVHSLVINQLYTLDQDAVTVEEAQKAFNYVNVQAMHNQPIDQEELIKISNYIEQTNLGGIKK